MLYTWPLSILAAFSYWLQFREFPLAAGQIKLVSDSLEETKEQFLNENFSECFALVALFMSRLFYFCIIRFEHKIPINSC